MQCLVGDINGRVLAEVTPLVESVSEVVNGVGRASLVFSRHDDKLTADNLRFGNRLYIEFPSGFKWGGVFDPPRRWSANSVAVAAYSGEHLLGWRTTGKERRFTGVTKGEIYQAVLSEGFTLPALVTGQIWQGGVAHSPRYHLEGLLDLARDSICDRLGAAEFALIPQLKNGVIEFRAELYERRGVDKNLMLVEGGNVTDAELLEQGPIINDWTIAGADVSGDSSDGWGDGRLLASAEDVTSMGLYGRRQGGEVLNDISVETTLQGKADSLRDEHGRPHNIFSLAVVDEQPAKFADYGLGDSLLLQLPSFGFGGTNTRVRVLGREFFPQDGVMNLVVREVT